MLLNQWRDKKHTYYDTSSNRKFEANTAVYICISSVQVQFKIPIVSGHILSTRSWEPETKWSDRFGQADARYLMVFACCHILPQHVETYFVIYSIIFECFGEYHITFRRPETEDARVPSGNLSSRHATNWMQGCFPMFSPFPLILLGWFNMALTSGSALLGGYMLTAGACRLEAQTATTR